MEQEEKKEIVSTMISQHRVLQGEVASILDKEKKDSEEISQELEKFKNDLTEHLKLENEVFYVELLKDMKSQGFNTTKTEEFIAEMESIGRAVSVFLEKYKNASSIQGKIQEFKKELEEIGGVLTLRIESEEAGVFTYWE